MNKLRIALFAVALVALVALALTLWGGAPQPLAAAIVVLLVLVNDRQLSRLEERVEDGYGVEYDVDDYTDEDRRRDYVLDMAIEVMRNATACELREQLSHAEFQAEESARRVFDGEKAGS